MYPVELGRYLIQDHLSSIHILSYSHIFSRFGSFLMRGRHENSGRSRTGHAAEDARTGCHWCRAVVAGLNKNHLVMDQYL